MSSSLGNTQLLVGRAAGYSSTNAADISGNMFVTNGRVATSGNLVMTNFNSQCLRFETGNGAAHTITGLNDGSTVTSNRLTFSLWDLCGNVSYGANPSRVALNLGPQNSYIQGDFAIYPSAVSGGRTLGSGNLIVSGNVGIGETNPGFPLDIYNGTANSTNLQLKSYVNTTGTSQSHLQLVTGNYGGKIGGGLTQIVGPLMTFHTINNGTSTEVMRMLNTNVGIGTTNPSHQLSVGGSTGMAIYSNISGQTQTFNATGAGTYIGWNMMNGGAETDIVNFNSGGYSGGFAFYNTTGSTFSSSSPLLMRITAAGNVGIGTTNPQNTLDVSGNMLIGTTTKSTDATFNNRKTLTFISPYTGHSDCNLSLWSGHTSGFCGARGGDAVIMYSAVHGTITGQSGRQGLFIGGHDTPGYIRLDSSGNVGISTLDPQCALDVNGIIRGSSNLQLTGTGSTITMGQSSTNPQSQNTYYITGPSDSGIANSATLTTVYGKGMVLKAPDFVGSFFNNGGGFSNTPNAYAGSVYIQAGDLNNGANDGTAPANMNGGHVILQSGSAFWSSTNTTGINHGDVIFYSGSGTNSTTKVERMRVVGNTGNVGIGIVNPQSQLHLYSTTATSYASPWSALSLMNTNAGGAGGCVSIDFSTYNTVGYTPAARIQAIDNYYGADLAFLSKIQGSTGNAMSEKMRISAAGNVGIGTTNPTYKLDVAGSIRSNSSTYLTGDQILASTAGSQSNSILTVGSGTSTAFGALKFIGNRTAAGADWVTSSLRIQKYVDSTNMGYMEFGALGGNQDIAFGNNGNERMRITAAGNVGIGTTSPSCALDIVGSTQLTNTSTGSFNNFYGKVPPNSTYPSTVKPNTTSATSSTWTNNGVTWSASASSVYLTYSIFRAFNATNSDSFAAAGTYTSGVYSGNISTNIIGQGNKLGEWLQIQSNVPVVMSSYQFATGGQVFQLPKTYWIVGSNDGSNWYPIQSATIPGTFSTTNTLISTVVSIPTQVTGSTYGTSTITTVPYSPTTAYTYFRLIATSLYTSGSLLEIGEWAPTFNPTLSGPSRTLLYMDANNINQLDVSGSLAVVNSNPSSMMVSPNTTLAISNLWQNNNITWSASASSYFTGTTNYFPYLTFDTNISANRGWLTAANNYNATTGAYAGSTAAITPTTQSAIQGEWLQLQSSVPVVMKSYNIGAIDIPLSHPRTFWILGSNDGTSWNPIHYATTTATSGVYPNFTYIGNFNVTSGTAVNGFTTVTTFPSYSSLSYTYFRIVVISTFPNVGNTYAYIGEWAPVFTPASSAVSLALDNAVPNQLNIGGSLGITGGITPMYSTPSFGPGQIGYVWTTYGHASPKAGALAELSSAGPIPTGVFVIAFQTTSANSMTPQWAAYNVKLNGVLLFGGGNDIVMQNNGNSYITASATTVAINTVPSQYVYFMGRSQYNDYWGYSGTLTVARIA